MKLIVLCLLLCLSSAQKHEAVDGASNEEADQWTSHEHVSLHASASHAPPNALSSEVEYDYDDLDLDSEEDQGRGRAKDEYVDEDEDKDKEYFDYYKDEEEDDEDKGGEERIKRKVIFGGGGGYGGVHRSRGGGGGGDPYGRRRDNHNYHGPDYGSYGSWPYGRSEYVDTSSFDQATVTNTPEPSTSTTASSSTRSPKSRAYGIVRSSPDGGDVPSSSGRKSKIGHREAKKKLPKNLKWEIAQYALQHGTRQAVHHYSQQVGKRISEKKIDKFVRRYQQRQEKVEARQN